MRPDIVSVVLLLFLGGCYSRPLLSPLADGETLLCQRMIDLVIAVDFTLEVIVFGVATAIGGTSGLGRVSNVRVSQSVRRRTPGAMAPEQGKKGDYYCRLIWDTVWYNTALYLKGCR